MTGQAVRTFVVAVVGLAASMASVASADPGQPTPALRLERDATKLVERIDEIGRDIQYHVGRLEDFAAHPDVSRWSHYYHLDGISALVNSRLRPALGRLTDMQRRLPAWKQESIDRMVSAARDLVNDTNSAYFRKNQNPQLPPMMNDEYQQLVRNLASHAKSLVTTADAAHAFALGQLKATEAGLSVTR